VKFVTVRDLRSTPAHIWRELEIEKELIVTNHGKPIALLTPVTGENFEGTIKAMRRARAETALRVIHEEAVRDGRDLITDDEIDEEIRQSRRNRAR
jgi:antitoxin (DNA-binding transcriptional repressor) of toxin-antitoxin stability system